MAATALDISTGTKDKAEFDRTKWRQEREAQLRRIMTPINANRGTENCGHIVLRLNHYLSDLDSLCLKPDPDLNIEPVPTTNANQMFHYHHHKNSPRARTCHLTGMETDSTDIAERCVLDANKFKEIVDLTKNNTEGEILIDLTLDSKSEKETTEKLKLNHASRKTIVDALRSLTRDSDNRVYGFLITASTISEQIQIHTSNFLVDEHNEVYFLDAQPAPVYIGSVLAPGCYDDLFYIASLPKPRANLSTSPTTLIKIKKELMEDISTPNLDLNDINIYESCRKKITERTLTKAEFEYITKLALNEQESTEINTVRAQYLYARCCHRGVYCNVDLKSAFEWTEKAAKQNNAAAQGHLGGCYAQGKGVAQDLKSAFEWYEKAAKQNNAAAQNHLGFCYCLGRGVEQNLTKAFEWFEKAAKQNHAAAQSNLGFCYEWGKGVAKDLTKAVEWYGRAAAQNYVPAVQTLAVLRNSLNNGQSAKKKLDEDSQAENKILKAHIEALKERVQASEYEANALKRKNSALQKIHQSQVQLLQLQIKKLQDERATATVLPSLSTSNNASTSSTSSSSSSFSNSSSSTNGNYKSHRSRKRPHSGLSVNGGAAVASMPAAAITTAATAAATAGNQMIVIDASASEGATTRSPAKRAKNV